MSDREPEAPGWTEEATRELVTAAAVLVTSFCITWLVATQLLVVGTDFAGFAVQLLLLVTISTVLLYATSGRSILTAMAVYRQAADRTALALALSEADASSDPLTGLPNRRSLDDVLARLGDARAEYAVVFCDLDHFKAVNDRHGHATGDEVLRVAATALRSAVRDIDVVARYGGEEFVLVLPNATREIASRVAQRARVQLATAMADAGCPPVTASFGVADSRQGNLVAQILLLADEAVYDAKHHGRDRVVVSETLVLR